MTNETDTHTTPQDASAVRLERFGPGFGWGLVATVLMSIPMIAGALTGLLPMPRPIPAAIVGELLGGGLARPVHLGLAAGSHLLYGGVAGGLLAVLTRPVTVAKGVGWGVLLWALMGVAWLPFLGWGMFGTEISPRVTVATLVLHLIYGVSLGWFMDRQVRAS